MRRPCFFVLAAFSCLLAHPAEPVRTRQPNIIVLLADDLGYGELGCQGNPEIPTPNIDSIAARGIRFTQGYVTAPNCSPSRAGLLTGRIPTRFGYEFNPIGARNEDPGTGLPSSEKTLAEALRGAGYATGIIGKWHLGGAADFHPQRHGFDEFFGFLHEGHFYVPPPWTGVTTLLRRQSLPGHRTGRWQTGSVIYSTHMGSDEPPYDANNPILRGSQPVNESAVLTDAFTREAVDFIERHQEQPFFLYLAYNAVHSPLQGADRYLERLSHIQDLHRRIFAAMLCNLDDSVGAILRKLAAANLAQETIIFFLSDNGGPTKELTSSNRPLRGGKGDMYEGGLRIPFMVRWPGHLPEGRVDPRPVISMDIFATAAKLAGLEPPANLDGVDLLPCLTGSNPEPPHDTFFWRQGRRTALRHGPWKLLNMRGDLAHPAWELYNLDHDPEEQTNLARTDPERLRDLQTLWSQYNEQMKAPLFRQ